MSNQLVEYVYYVVPSNISVNSVSGVTNDTIGMVIMHVTLGNYIFGGLKQFNINVTPQAFIGWYNQNSPNMTKSTMQYYSSIVNSLNSPINGYSSDISYTDTIDYQEGFRFLPYSQVSSFGLIIPNNVIDPVANYGFTSNNLYAVYKELNNGKPNSTTLSINNTSTTNIPNNNYNSTTPNYTNSQNINLANTTTNLNNAQGVTQTLTQNQLASGTQIPNAIKTLNTTAPFLEGDFVLLAIAGIVIGAAILIFELKIPI